jgi:hypothetical protein
MAQLYGLTADQVTAVKALGSKVNSQSTKTRQTGMSSYRPGATQLAIGKITETVKRDSTAAHSTWKGKFQPYAAPDPQDDTSVEVAVEGEQDCWIWTTLDLTEITPGKQVTCALIAGRWYIIGCESCPTSVTGSGDSGGGSDE